MTWWQWGLVGLGAYAALMLLAFVVALGIVRACKDEGPADDEDWL